MIAPNKDGLWPEDILLNKKVTGVEKTIRDVGNLCDDLFLTIRLIKYPLTSDLKEYSLVIGKVKDNKLLILYKAENMELQLILNSALKWLKEYQLRNKRYDLQKPGGGELI